MKSALVALSTICLVAGCASDGSPLATSSTTAATQTELSLAVASASLKPASSLTTASGTFIGENGYVAEGTASIFRYKGGWFVHLEPDFRVDDAPGPKVALGDSAQGGFKRGAVLVRLDSLKGEQAYAINPGLDIGDYDQIYICSEPLNITLGRADLTLL